MKKVNSKNGITLIALVITIIVLLILAGVSINAISGDNGIVPKAKDAKEETDEAISEEKSELERLDASIDTALGKDVSEFGKLKEANSYVESKIVVSDKNGDYVTIPAGFKIAADSGNSVIEGIVIEDDDVIDGGSGNQYVWVPVTVDANGDATELYTDTGTLSNGEEIKLSRYLFENNGNAVDRGEEYAIYGFVGEGEAVSVSNTPMWCTIEEYENIEVFKASVAENGGYYIARYEASYGIDEQANSKKSISYSGDWIEGRLWNNINREDAIVVSQNLYLDITSELINSYAYDTAIVYVQKCSNNSTYSRYSTQKDELNNTGSTKDEVCKINDLAGNVAEWTTETGQWGKGSTFTNINNTVFGFVARGGRFNNIDCWASYRGSSSTGYTVAGTEEVDYFGFRTILYF